MNPYLWFMLIGAIFACVYQLSPLKKKYPIVTYEIEGGEGDVNDDQLVAQ